MILTPILREWRFRLRHPPKIEPRRTLWYTRPRLGASWGPPGTSCGRLEPLGASWSLLGPPGASWGLLGPPGSSDAHAETQITPNI